LQGWREDWAECTLVLISATIKGRTKLVRFGDRVRASVQRWRELLVEIKRRGLPIRPWIAAGDEALGSWKVLDELFSADIIRDVGRKKALTYSTRYSSLAVRHDGSLTRDLSSA
jgi:hypothetical protein